jgi:hypothetical protein
MPSQRNTPPKVVSTRIIFLGILEMATYGPDFEGKTELPGTIDEV